MKIISCGRISAESIQLRSAMCKLRDYRPGDEEAVFRIVKEVLAGYGLTTNPEETDSDLKDIQESYIANGGLFRVVEAGGKIIGSCGLYALTPQSCELRKMYLLPAYRGRGLGRRMLVDALHEATERGFVEMTLETNSRLKEAIGLYQAYGFVPFTPDHLSDRCDLAMKKALRAGDSSGQIGRSPIPSR